MAAEGILGKPAVDVGDLVGVPEIELLLEVFHRPLGERPAEGCARAGMGARVNVRETLDGVVADLIDRGESPTVHLEVSGELVPDARSANVIGRLRADSSPQRLVVCAHYDTTVGTPSAYDNASGVGGVVALARRLLEQPAGINVDFIAFAGEEGGFSDRGITWPASRTRGASEKYLRS